MAHYRDERRIPTGIQRLNQWLLPILVVGVLSAMGFYALREQTTSIELTTVATYQKTAMKNQDEMKKDIKEIRDNQDELKDALDAQTYQMKLDRIRITTMHHVKGIVTCSGCHERKKLN